MKKPFSIILSSIPLRIKRRIGEASYHIRIVMRVGCLANLLSALNLLKKIEDGLCMAGVGIGICLHGELAISPLTQIACC
jgi:hypothetical protein